MQMLLSRLILKLMNKLKNNQSGFSSVEGLLIIIIVILISAVGYMVYKNQTKTTNSSTTVSKTASTPMPSDWQKFVSLDKSVSFSYPKAWGTLTEASRGSIYPSVAINSLTDFNLKIIRGDGPPTNFWYSWDTKSSSIVEAEDMSPPADYTASSYIKPNILGNKTVVVPTFTAGGFDIYKIEGRGAINCGGYDFVFVVNDKIVDIQTILCERGGAITAENYEAQYSDIYTDAFVNFYKYL